ncbi:hypothetical protein [Thalassovita taeanensis]|uniref:hypothetical protein n=1 Tax=Thalassovita taeanensis TaxID=657014 RepID=UPI0015877A1A|nr:hypothetical protein [Thalassovita taeanensis]
MLNIPDRPDLALPKGRAQVGAADIGPTRKRFHEVAKFLGSPAQTGRAHGPV